MSVKFSNNGKTTLSAGITNSATSISVVDASVLPSISGSDYFYITLQDTAGNVEIAKVTAVSSNTLTALRGQEGTTARSFASGDKAENRLTAGGLADITTSTDLNLDAMTGDGSTTTLTLSVDPSTEDNTQVYIDGVYQNKTTYSVSGTTLTFSTAPPSGSEVEVMIITPADGLTSSFTDYATAAQGIKADNALPRSGGAMTGPITTNSTIDGRDVAADGSKLDNIEAGATADQTDEEIQDIVGAMVSGNAESGISVSYDDTNGKLNFSVDSQTDVNFTTADHNKLDGIEAGATADQTASEIRALVDSASDSNVFTDADHTKLDGIEASADVTDTANVVSALTAGTNINIASDGTVGTTATQDITAASLGASANGTVDISSSATRFRDLYLSRNAYINSNIIAGTNATTVHNTTTTGLNYIANAWLSVNSTNESLLLTQQNQTAWIRFYYRNGGEKGSISFNGTGTSYNTSSDQRLKENIVDAPCASEDIDAIKIRSFDWKANGSNQKYGVIAQELLEVAPEAVTQPDSPDDMMSVDYSKLVPMLVKEIQTLRARVADLESK